jgi:hypothetical protein
VKEVGQTHEYVIISHPAAAAAAAADLVRFYFKQE